MEQRLQVDIQELSAQVSEMGRYEASEFLSEFDDRVIVQVLEELNPYTALDIRDDFHRIAEAVKAAKELLTEGANEDVRDT